MKRKNLFLIAVTLGLYIINQHLKNVIPYKPIKWIMQCYFNDFIGGITFISYCNIIFECYREPVKQLWKIEILLLCCGIFWEYITPLYRSNTVSDIFDIVAYMGGGFLYWLIIRKSEYDTKKCKRSTRNR